MRTAQIGPDLRLAFSLNSTPFKRTPRYYGRFLWLPQCPYKCGFTAKEKIWSRGTNSRLSFAM